MVVETVTGFMGSSWGGEVATRCRTTRRRLPYWRADVNATRHRQPPQEHARPPRAGARADPGRRRAADARPPVPRADGRPRDGGGRSLAHGLLPPLRRPARGVLALLAGIEATGRRGRGRRAVWRGLAARGAGRRRRHLRPPRRFLRALEARGRAGRRDRGGLLRVRRPLHRGDRRDAGPRRARLRAGARAEPHERPVPDGHARRATPASTASWRSTRSWRYGARWRPAHDAVTHPARRPARAGRRRQDGRPRGAGRAGAVDACHNCRRP